MLRPPAMIGAPARQAGKSVHSVACLAYVGVLGAAFWAGALWIGETLVRLLAG